MKLDFSDLTWNTWDTMWWKRTEFEAKDSGSTFELKSHFSHTIVEIKIHATDSNQKQNVVDQWLQREYMNSLGTAAGR